MPQRTVQWFTAQKGYGFIQPQRGSGVRDVFVHITAVSALG